MITKRVIGLFTILLLSCISFSSFSQQSNSRGAKAVLVQIRSEHNRLQAMYHAKDLKRLQEVKRDAKGVAMAMINDFKDHFNYCPVYFYMDTNREYIKERKFEGVLFNAEGEIIDNPVISSKDTNYLIVFYGHAAEQSRNRKVTEANAKVNTVPFGLGLVILNYKFDQVDYLYKLAYEDAELKIRAKRHPELKRYFYFSKHFDMEYYPFAKRLNERHYTF